MKKRKKRRLAPAVIHCVLYARHSPSPEEATRDSCFVQLEQMRAYAAKQGWVVRAEYYDQNVSAAKHDREGLWAALAALESGDVFLVRDNSRISRDPHLGYMVRKKLQRQHATLCSIEGGGLWEDNPQNRLVANILDSLNEFQRDVIRMRSSQGFRARLRKGLAVSDALFGLKVRKGTKTMIVNSDEFWIVEICWRILSEGKTPHQCYKKVYEMGAKSRKGKPIARNTVYRICNNLNDGMYEQFGLTRPDPDASSDARGPSSTGRARGRSSASPRPA